jgi:xanthine dehydrogenase small subunit
VALTGFLLTSPTLSIDDAIAAIEGNICRCTGYTAIRRAVAKLVSSLNLAQDSDLEARHEQLHQTGLLPDIFHNIRQRLQGIPATSVSHSNGAVVAGGTDLFVQHADELANSRINFIPCSCTSPLEIQNNKIVIDASATAEELRNSQIFTNTIPPWHSKLQLLSSTMIRNQATVAGNIVNASPIADLSIIFLALNATLLIKSDDTTRELPLDQFYHDYKIFDLKQTEIIDKLTIPILSQEDHFNFEKVSRREHLDIASVNSAALLHTEAGAITSARISAGGVGPTPMFLKKTSAFLKGREINTATILEATQIAESEISPISYVRGSAGYKRSLLKRLVLAHFIECFPNANLEEAVHELT